MSTYPVNIINDNQSVLLLYSAAFEGYNDVKYYKNIQNVTLVDIDKEKLNKMKNKIYKNEIN